MMVCDDGNRIRRDQETGRNQAEMSSEPTPADPAGTTSNLGTCAPGILHASCATGAPDLTNRDDNDDRTTAAYSDDHDDGRPLYSYWAHSFTPCTTRLQYDPHPTIDPYHSQILIG